MLIQQISSQIYVNLNGELSSVPMNEMTTAAEVSQPLLRVAAGYSGSSVTYFWLIVECILHEVLWFKIHHQYNGPTLQQYHHLMNINLNAISLSPVSLQKLSSALVQCMRRLYLNIWSNNRMWACQLLKTFFSHWKLCETRWHFWLWQQHRECFLSVDETLFFRLRYA